MLKKTKVDTPAIIEIAPRQIEVAELLIIGDSPLVVHRWSEKARKQIEDNQAKKAKSGKKEPRDPKADFNAARYVRPDHPPLAPRSAPRHGIDRGAGEIIYVSTVDKLSVLSYNGAVVRSTTKCRRTKADRSPHGCRLDIKPRN